MVKRLICISLIVFLILACSGCGIKNHTKEEEDFVSITVAVRKGEKTVWEGMIDDFMVQGLKEGVLAEERKVMRRSVFATQVTGYIYCIINQIVSEGKSVVMISSELPEVLGMSDRIYVMNEGQIVGELDAAEASQEKIMSLIVNKK